MNICIRTDASLEIGSGHLMRCLTLADKLRLRGARVTFVCRAHKGNMIDLLVKNEYHVEQLPRNENKYLPSTEDGSHAAWLGASWQEDAIETIAVMGDSRPSWLIIDHYAIDYRWEKRLRPLVGKIMVIDDLADRCHDCDLLLDQNLYENLESRYFFLVPNSCKLLLGPKFALLRSEFSKAREYLRNRTGDVQRIMISFGGSDPSNETMKALRSVLALDRHDLAIDVVVGGTNARKAEIAAYCDEHSFVEYYCQIDNMAEIMAKADLSIGGGGGTTWERMCLGLPSIVITIAKNQEQLIEDISQRGAVVYLGVCEQVSSEKIYRCLVDLLNDKTKLMGMTHNSFLLVDGFGCRRVAEYIFGFLY